MERKIKKKLQKIGTIPNKSNENFSFMRLTV